MSQADIDFEARKKDLVRRLDDIEHEVEISNRTGEERRQFLIEKIAELKEVTRLLTEAFAAEIDRNYRGVEFGHEGGS
jgi:hypothetical protein